MSNRDEKETACSEVLNSELAACLTENLEKSSDIVNLMLTNRAIYQTIDKAG